MHVPPEHLFDPPRVFPVLSAVSLLSGASPLRPALSSLLQCLPFSRISSSVASCSAYPASRFPRGYWTFRLHGRQVYFYSIRFIRLNMTCGYSPGDIFPILRDDIPTLVVPRVSCILCPYRSSAPFPALALSTTADRGKIRTILSRIIAASGEFMDVPHPRR